MGSRDKERLTTAPISKYCEDLLEISTQVNKRSRAQQISIYLTEAILNHEDEIKKQVQYLADEAGVSFQEMWDTLKES